MATNVVAVRNEWDIFLGDYWGPHECRPNSWTYKASKYEVEGVTIDAPAHMKLWSEVKSWINPGRKKGVNIKHLNNLSDDIVKNGINTDCPFIYYDVETGELVNGDHRSKVSEQLNIAGWMMQPVKFKNEAAKIRFATISNKKWVDNWLGPDAPSVEVSVRELVNMPDESGVITDAEIRAEVRSLGKDALSESKIADIANKLILERIYNGGKISKESRFQTWSAALLTGFLHYTQDSWIDDFYHNVSEEVLFVNIREFESRIGGILESGARAKRSNKPLHFLFSVPLAENEKLDTTRSKVFTDRLWSLEKRMADNEGIDVKSITNTASWNHPDCEHRFLPQDLELEDKFYCVELDKEK